jgi:hypothetical protein
MEDFPGPFAVFPEHSVEDLYFSCLSDQQMATGKLALQVATSLQAVEELRPVWKEWTRNLNTDFDYYLHTLRNDPTILSPYVITVYQDGVAEAMLVGQVRKQRISTVVSFVNIRGPKVRMLEIVNGGRMGRQSATIDQLLALQLCGATRRAKVDLLCFQRLPLQSELFRMLQKSPGLLMKQRVPHVFHYSVVPLTASPGKHVRAFSGKNRREIRRKTRILERTFPGRARVQCFSQPEELEIGLREAASVDVTTWQHYLGCGLLDARQSHDNLAFCARQGWLRIYVMYVDQSPAAFLIGQHYNHTFYCQHAGYHPDFSRFSVGSLLTAWVLESLSAAGVEQVDLGEGSQEHNRRLGCRVYEEGTVHVYCPTWRGVCLNMLFGATQTIRAVGRRTITKLHLGRASRAWSRFLISRWKARKLVGDSCL